MLVNLFTTWLANPASLNFPLFFVSALLLEFFNLQTRAGRWRILAFLEHPLTRPDPSFAQA